MEMSQAGGKSKKIPVLDLLHAIAREENQSQTHYAKVMSERFDCSPNTVQNAITNAVSEGCLRFVVKGRKKLYRLTEKGRKRASETPEIAGGENE